ncbi:hypothetical protein Pelo_19405 [Pelomyxa schiedti]|nr:hypothetical protein Pelo_19405 [Pelomyxa schiedti]
MSEAVEIATDVFVCICIAAFLVSLSGLTVHSIRNRKAFKRRNIFYLRFSMPHTSNGITIPIFFPAILPYYLSK